MDIDPTSLRPAERWYRRLLRVYPRAFREETEATLLADFRDGWRAAVQSGPAARARFWTLMILDLVRSAVPEWITLLRALRSRSPADSVGSGGPMDSLWQDIRYAVRTLRRAPGLTVVAVLTIALGTAATTTILSVANAVLLRTPTGIMRSGELVTLDRRIRNGQGLSAFSYPDFRDLRAASAGLKELAGYRLFTASLTTEREPELQMGMGVSNNFFSVLGTRPALGRFFTADEDRVVGGPRVVVLSHSTWTKWFGGDPKILGRAITVNGAPATVVGVAEPGFRGPLAGVDVGLWVPLVFSRSNPDVTEFENRRMSWIRLIGRLAPGATPSSVAAMLSPQFDRWGRDIGDASQRAVGVESYSPVPASAFLSVVGFLGFLLLLALLILAIASTNVAGVLLARAVGRSREIAVRLAIGAGRRRLVRQLLTESILLFLLGAAAGALLALWITAALRSVHLPIPVATVFDFHPDGRVFIATLIVGLAAGVGFGLAPAWQAVRPDLTDTLKHESDALRYGRLRLRSGLVAAQVAGSVLLLALGGLFARALGNAGRIDIGFDPAGVHALAVDLDILHYPAERSRQFFENLEREAAAIPGVTGVGLADVLPLTLEQQGVGITIPGRPQGEGATFFTDDAAVTPGYLPAMGYPMVRGRGFTSADRLDAPAVVLVNETLAAELWPGEDAVGKVLQYRIDQLSPPATVVGIVRNGKYRSLGEAPVPMLYLPLAQQSIQAASLVVRSNLPPADLSRRLGEIVRGLDPDLPISQNAPLSDLIGIALMPNRIVALLAGLFGAVGLILVVVGLYGILSYMVSRRRREIGIRMALGAEAGDVRALVLRDGLRLTLTGVAIGVVLAAVVSYLMRSFLYGLSALDPLTFGGVAVLMVGVAWAACYLPARRATLTAPTEALRSE